MENKKVISILIIDDDELIRILISSYLNDNGYKTKTAENGKEGIDLLKKGDFDLILLDLNMPVMDGFEVLKIVKKDFPDLPVVVISGMGNQAPVVESFRMGATNYLIKPIGNLEIITLTINNAIEKMSLVKKNKEYEKNLEKMILQKTKALQESNKQYKIAKEKAEKSNTLKTTILSNISHELRTPMNAIIGFSRRLLESDISVEYMEYVDIILTRGLDLLTIINNILYFAEAVSGKVYKMKTTFHVNELFNELYIEYEKKLSKIKNANVQLKFKPDKDANDTIILTDYEILKRILSNLLSNSLKFTKSGKIELAYKIINEDKIEFYVKDTGIGITAKQKKTIFEYFIQSISEYKKYSDGLGLGLPLAKKLVEILGGEMKLISTQGKGTTVSFYLPRFSSKKLK